MVPPELLRGDAWTLCAASKRKPLQESAPQYSEPCGMAGTLTGDSRKGVAHADFYVAASWGKTPLSIILVAPLLGVSVRDF